MNDQMAVLMLKKLLGLAQEVADDAIHDAERTEAERKSDIEQQRRTLEEAQKMLRVLQEKVDVMLEGRPSV